MMWRSVKIYDEFFKARVVFRDRAIFHLSGYADGYNLRILESNF
jgi:hypothetical protein